MGKISLFYFFSSNTYFNKLDKEKKESLNSFGLLFTRNQEAKQTHFKKLPPEPR